MLIKILKADFLGSFTMKLSFSDGKVGLLDGRLLLQRNGSLLEPLHDESYFRRHFIEAGALNWPNGLELSPAKLHQTCPEVMAD